MKRIELFKETEVDEFYGETIWDDDEVQEVRLGVARTLKLNLFGKKVKLIGRPRYVSYESADKETLISIRNKIDNALKKMK